MATVSAPRRRKHRDTSTALDRAIATLKEHELTHVPVGSIVLYPLGLDWRAKRIPERIGQLEGIGPDPFTALLSLAQRLTAAVFPPK